MRVQAVLALVVGLVLGGCQNAPEGAAGGGMFTSAKGGEKVTPPSENDPSMDWSDPCAVNMNALVENLLMYYSSHNSLPKSLTELPAKSIEGQAVRLTCPETNLPYKYVPAGLVAPREVIPTGVRLILYDDQPAHYRTLKLNDGTREALIKQKVRFGIVMVPPASSVGAGFTSAGGVQLYVVPIEQNLLNLYLKGGEAIQFRPVPAE